MTFVCEKVNETEMNPNKLRVTSYGLGGSGESRSWLSAGL